MRIPIFFILLFLLAACSDDDMCDCSNPELICKGEKCICPEDKTLYRGLCFETGPGLVITEVDCESISDTVQIEWTKTSDSTIYIALQDYRQPATILTLGGELQTEEDDEGWIAFHYNEYFHAAYFDSMKCYSQWKGRIDTSRNVLESKLEWVNFPAADRVMSSCDINWSL